MWRRGQGASTAGRFQQQQDRPNVCRSLLASFAGSLLQFPQRFAGDEQIGNRGRLAGAITSVIAEARTR